MLDSISRHIWETTPRIISPWEQYVATLRIWKNDLRKRFQMSPGYESRGITLLRHILSYIDLEYLLKQPDDYNRYLYHIRFIRKDLQNLFDPVSTGRSYRKVFIKKKVFPTNEYIVPVDDVDHLSILPFNKPWEDWKHIRPVRLWDHDSPEYTQYLLEDMLGFRYVQPSYAIITIDVVSLVFKYFKYLTDQSPENDVKSDRIFLHKYVLDGFMDDQLDIWLLKQLRLAMDIDDEKDVATLYANTVTYDNKYGFIGNRYEEAMMAIYHELIKVKQGSTTVNSFLSSKLLHSGSIIDRYNLMDREIDIPRLRQYQYMRFLRDLPLLELIIKLHEWRPDTQTYRNLLRDLKIKVRAMQKERFWAKITDPVIKTEIEEYVNTLYENLNNR